MPAVGKSFGHAPSTTAAYLGYARRKLVLLHTVGDADPADMICLSALIHGSIVQFSTPPQDAVKLFSLSPCGIKSVFECLADHHGSLSHSRLLFSSGAERGVRPLKQVKPLYPLSRSDQLLGFT